MEDISIQVTLSSEFDREDAKRIAKILRNNLAEFSQEQQIRTELSVRGVDAELEWLSHDVTVRVEIPSGHNAMRFRNDLGVLVDDSLGGQFSVKLVAIPVHIKILN